MSRPTCPQALTSEPHPNAATPSPLRSQPVQKRLTPPLLVPDRRAPWFDAVCQDAHPPNESVVAKMQTAFVAMTTPQTIAYTLCTSFSEAHRMRQEWLEYLQRLDWNTPMTLALASGAVGSVITLAWISARDARERRRQRRDTALELALSLESYARTCRTMMHKAAWAAAEPAGLTSRETSKSVSIPALPIRTNFCGTSSAAKLSPSCASFRQWCTPLGSMWTRSANSVSRSTFVARLNTNVPRLRWQR
jgi:hypothetical protein